MQHPVMHTAKHLFGFHNERFIMALHLQVHGYILNRKKAQHHKSNHTRKNHKRDFGRGLWVTTVCVPEPRVSCRPQHHAARAAQAAASPQSPEQGPSVLSPFPTGRGVCQELCKCEKKKGKRVKAPEKSYAKRHQKGSVHRQLQALPCSTWHKANCMSCVG